MVSLATIKTLSITFAPLLLPKLLSFYRSARRPANSHTHSHNHLPAIRPCPRSATRALNILFLSALLAFFSTIPYFHPENIFTLTNSRLHTPTDVLFTRLAIHRPLTPFDNSLKTRLVSLEGRLLYFQHGPSTLADCRFCSSNSPISFLYYALPAMLLPHIIHLLLIGAATSRLLGANSPVTRWRTAGTIAVLMLAAAEGYLVGTYNHKLNTSSRQLSDIDFFHWKALVWRGIAIACTDALFAGLVWGAATNRLFVRAKSKAERVADLTKQLEGANRKLHALGITKNVVYRDAGLRREMVEYWVKEGTVVGEVFEDREVVESVNKAVEKMDMGRIVGEAGQYAEQVTGGVKIVEANDT